MTVFVLNQLDAMIYSIIIRMYFDLFRLETISTLTKLAVLCA